MSWIAVILVIVIGYAIYTMIINQQFLRCPHCGKLGSWRFDPINDSVDEYDDDGALTRSVTRQRCRKCDEEVVHIWSDFEGREIRLPSDRIELQ